jgi:sialidase-1
MIIGVVGVKAQVAVTVGDQVTDVNNIVSGKAYLLRWDGLTGTPYALDNGGDNYGMANNNTATQAAVYYLISDGNGGYKIENAYTGKYWPTPSSNGEFIAPTTAANAGTWTIAASETANRFTFTCSGYHTNRSSSKLVAHTSDSPVSIYEVTASSLSTVASYSDFADKDISVSATEAASISEGQWYVMKNRGRNVYAYENNGSMRNQAAAPSGLATENAKFLVRFVNAGSGKYYLQNGLGNYWGAIPQNTAVPATALGTEKYTAGKINSTDGHFYFTSETNGIVLDCQDPGYPVVGWETSIPTTTGGNNDWQFFPIEFVESWVPAIDEVYTINNTNSNRGALIYNSDNPKYVWSSGKSGTFDATNANSQWVIYPTRTNGQFYLYNVGADKFAIPTGIAQSNAHSWVFSDNAVAVVFELQDDGTKKIKMANNPVSGNNQAYMGVSNGYTGPIINWNDDGSKFTITKVDGVDASSAVTTAVNNLVYNSSTALTGAVSEDDGWYVIQIKTTSNTTATASPGRYVYPGPTGNDNYPLTFTGGVDCQPSIKDATFYTRFVKNGSVYNWQLPNGQYLVQNSGNLFPTLSSEAAAVTPGYNNGSYINGGSRYADPYVSSGNFFIGETASYRTTWNIYPINLSNAGLTAWQMICDNAPETQEITCSRSDVSGLTSVYKNGFIFLPTGVTPESTDFTLGGATDIVVDATNHKVNFTYDPNLAIVIDGVTVAQGWQTAGRDNEVMLMRVNAKPFKDATGTMMTVSLKDGAEANISKLTLYEASSESPEIYSTGTGAPTKTVVAEVNNPSATAAFSIGSFAAGQHYYWIGATVKSDATLGDILDAAVTGITYTCNGNETTLDLTSVGDPADRGAIVFNAHSYPYLPRDNGSRVYRIPAMIVADDGSIVVAADKRYDSHTDIGAGHVIDIVIRRSTDGGKTWSDPKVVAKGLGTADDAKCGYGDPSLVKGKDGKLYCLFVAGNLGYSYGQQRIAMTTSSDNGVTWSSNETTPPIDLLESGRLKNYNTVGQAGYGLYDYFVTSGRGLYIPDDDILMYLIPAQTMTSATEHTGDSQDYIFYSRDGGESWYFSETPMINGGDEAKIIQMNDGSLFGSIRKYGDRRFNTATYSKNDDGKTLSFTFGTQWDNSQLHQDSQNNQDILYYQRETETGKTDVIIHSITTGNHANFKLYYSTDQGINWTEFLNVQTKGTRYVTMDKNPANGSLYLFFEDQSLNSAGGYTDYNHYPLNFLEITRDHLKKYITTLDDLANVNPVEGVIIAHGNTAPNNYGTFAESSGWRSSWTSKVADGLNTIAGLTLSTPAKQLNQAQNVYSSYVLALKGSAANTTDVITLTAPAGYVIEGYTLKARSYTSSENYTFTSGTTTITTTTGSWKTFEITDVNSKATTFNLTAPATLNQYACITDFVVNLKRSVEYKVVDGNGNEWASESVVFDTNSAADEMPLSLKRAFCTYSYYIDAACSTQVTSIDDLATIYVKCEYDGPFEFSTLENPKWYFMYAHKQNDENDYLAYTDGNTYSMAAESFVNKYRDEEYQWAFIGNPYAIKIMNRSNNGYLATSALPTTNNSALTTTAVSSDETAYPYNTFTLYGFSSAYIQIENPFHLCLVDQAGVFVNGANGNLYYHNAVVPNSNLQVTNWKDAYVSVLEVPQIVEVTVSAAATDGEFNYGTLYYSNMNLMVPEGVTAYTAAVSDGKITLTDITGAIPAGTGVVLKTDSKLATNTTFTFIKATTGGTAATDNMLLGTDDAAMTYAGEGSWKYYALSLNGSNSPNTVGFYYRKGCPNGEAFQNGAHKAYLAVPIEQASDAKGFAFSDAVTGIEVPNSETTQKGEGIYNLSGQRVSTLSKGIFIVNGKKVVVK